MADVSHVFGGPLAWSETGDLLLADGADMTQQRLVRRLMTNPGDVLDHPDYGAYLGRFVSDPVHPMTIRGLVREQASLETAIAQDPAPEVDLSMDDLGTLFLTLSYAEADGTPQAMQLNVGS